LKNFFLALFLSIHSHAAEKPSHLAKSILKELVEIDTTESAGSTTKAAEAAAKRLLAAGFPPADVQVIGPDDRHKNLVVRLRGKAKKKPILFISHLDVVEADAAEWSTDPFKFVEKDGYYYGRGVEDIKDGCALLLTTLIRLKQEGGVPDRDLIVALTAGEETGKANGVDWLLEKRKTLFTSAAFVLNPDAGAFQLEKGKRLLIGVQASEKLYADFRLEVKGAGGHSSRPGPDNAIYKLSDALGKLAKHRFPLELNEVTRGYFAERGALVGGQEGEDMKAVAKTPPDEAAAERLAKNPFYNARLRTTCVATRLDAGHANNALPLSAKATVNCRILPGSSAGKTRKTLEKLFDDPAVSVVQIDTSPISMAPNILSPLRDDVLGPLKKVAGEMYPGVPIVPFMDGGASDNAITRAAGIPTYGVTGIFLDVSDSRAHGKDERIPVASFEEAADFYYRFAKALAY
jgi:acetylornithine deacetylase/succinyl-diaminopimelate desuccinylase-like protein